MAGTDAASWRVAAIVRRSGANDCGPAADDDLYLGCPPPPGGTRGGMCMSFGSGAGEDPKRLIEQTFARGAEFSGPAEDLLLSWMLALPAEADAPAIAAILAERYRGSLPGGVDPRHPLARLLNLLEQTAVAGAERGRGRRRGRRGRGEGAT